MNTEDLAKQLLECSQAEIQELNTLLTGKIYLQVSNDHSRDGEPGEETDGDGDPTDETDTGNDTHPLPPKNG